MLTNFKIQNLFMKLHVNRGFKLKVGLDEIGSGFFFRSASEKLNQKRQLLQILTIFRFRHKVENGIEKKV